MPSLETYKRIYGAKGSTDGQARASHSRDIMKATWYEDIATKRCYFYDYAHDNEPLKLNNLTPDENAGMIPIDIKYIINGSQSLSRDDVDYHIQFKPDAGIEVPYYTEFFGDRYGAEYPVGLYCAIPDADGVYNRWMVVATANNNDTLFPTYTVLRCDYVFQWVYDGKCYQMPGVKRSQNSYNSGIWTDFKITVPENEQKFILPMTRNTEHLFYNQRLIIDNHVLTEPLAWKISKVNRINQNGTVLITLAQDMFDQNKDYIELDTNGNVIGMWADYYDEPINSDPIPTSSVYSVITFSAKAQLKVGGGYKKFATKFYNDGVEIPPENGTWSFTIDGVDASALVDFVAGATDSEMKIKFLGDDEYLGKQMIITYTSISSVASNVTVDIIGL